MIVYNRVLRNGLWLSRRKRWLPLVFIVSACIAVLMATPYSIAHGRIFLTVLCVFFAALGIVVRCAAGRRPKSTLEQTINSGGIYSVIRFPYYLSDILIMLGLTLYTGVGWYIFMMIPLGYFIIERIILSEESSMINRHGEQYLHWSKETNALIPAMLNWNKTSYRVGFTTLLRNESKFVLLTVIGFCLINLMKHLVIEFSFTVGAGWLIALLAAIAVFILGRLSPGSK